MTISRKEIVVLQKIRQGDQYARAAHDLDITVSCLKWRIHSARKKLGAKTITQAVADAVQKGLIQ